MGIRAWHSARSAAIIAASLTLVAGRAVAQEARGLVYLPDWPAHVLGLSGVVARPTGEFQSNVDWGGGVAFYWNVNPTADRHLGLRVEGNALLYGHERFEIPLAPSAGRVRLDVTTDNFIFGFGAGPQLTLFNGPVRPYVFGTVGFSYFATISSAGDDAGWDTFASTTNFDDWTLALSGGAGVLVRLARAPKTVALDLSVLGTRNGEADYLTRGGVVENGDGTVTVFPMRSDANLVTVRMGVVLGL
jgi:hypothetical protein